MLFIVPGSPRYGSIAVALLTIFQFIFIIWGISTSNDIEQSQTGFQVLVIVFSIACIIASVALIAGAIKLSKKLLLPYLCTMSAFIFIYAIVFIVMLHGDYSQKDWVHLTIMAVNICFLIGVGALYREILRAERPEFINVTISSGPPPYY